METAYKYLVDRGFDDELNELEVEDTITTDQIQTLINNHTASPDFSTYQPETNFDVGYDLGYAMALAELEKHNQESYKRGYIDSGIEALIAGK